MQIDSVEFPTLLDLASKAITAIVALVGLSVTVSQLTVVHRLRKHEVWAREASNSEMDERRKAVLNQIRVAATARLVAITFVPNRYFLELAFWIVIAPLALVRYYNNELDLWGYVWNFALVCLLLMTPVRRAVRAYCERHRVRSEFQAGGKAVVPPRLGIVDLMEGGTRKEFTLSALLSATTLAIVAGGVLAVRGIEPRWTVLVLVIGMVGTVAVGFAIEKYAVHLTGRGESRN